ncbi:MAG: hypothetical protein WDW36_009632 [Sanguina aurantia]
MTHRCHHASTNKRVECVQRPTCRRTPLPFPSLPTPGTSNPVRPRVSKCGGGCSGSGSWTCVALHAGNLPGTLHIGSTHACGGTLDSPPMRPQHPHRGETWVDLLQKRAVDGSRRDPSPIRAATTAAPRRGKVAYSEGEHGGHTALLLSEGFSAEEAAQVLAFYRRKRRQVDFDRVHKWIRLLREHEVTAPTTAISKRLLILTSPPETAGAYVKQLLTDPQFLGLSVLRNEANLLALEATGSTQ